MPAITAVIDNANGRAILNGTGLAAAPSKSYFQRVYPDGTAVNVRNAEPVPAGNASYTVSDWEIPPNSTVRYRITTIAGDGTSTSVDAASPSSWAIAFPYNARILHPTIPAISQTVIISEVSELTRDVRTEVHYPLGRPDPVVVAQVRQYPTGKLLLISFTSADRADLTLLLTQAAVFCVQTPFDNALGGGELWIAAGTLVERRTDTPSARTQYRIWELDFAQVGRPPGIIADLISQWQAVPPKYATWTAVVADKATWDAFLIGAELVPSS